MVGLRKVTGFLVLSLCCLPDCDASRQPPDWWNYDQALRPSTRIEGEKKAKVSSTEAEGQLEQARFYGLQGDLPRQIHHLKTFFSLGPTDPILLCLGWYSMAEALRSSGMEREREDAVRSYARSYSPELGLAAGLTPPSIMECWVKLDHGDLTGADCDAQALSNSEQSAVDPLMMAALGSVRAEIEFRKHRDPTYAKNVLLHLMDQMGAQSFLNDGGLIVSAIVCYERLFQPNEAIQLINIANRSGRGPTAVVPEAELARNELMLCHWDQAAKDLQAAQKVLLTYPPGIREEAGKNLDFAVADFCIATGHPQEALPILRRLRKDFLRPGFTTENSSYYEGGLHLRLSMASDRVLRLLLATTYHAGFIKALSSIPSVIDLFWERERARLLFRQSLTDSVRKAYPGRDIATLLFAPPWMLPEMSSILGHGVFVSLANVFMPEGRRKDILGPLISGRGNLPQDAPLMISSLISAVSKNDQDRITAWNSCHSATLLAGTTLPVQFLPDDVPISGWLNHSPTGLSCKSMGHASGIIKIVVEGGGKKSSLEISWPASHAGQIEAMNTSLLNADREWGAERISSIHGRNIGITVLQSH
jgi:hypothetical protein